MRVKLLIIATTLSWGCLLLASFFTASAQQPTVRVRVSELDQMPFNVGALKIIVARLKTGPPSQTDAGSAEVQVENTSSQFATYSPHRLTLVGSDNTQVNVIGIRHDDDHFPAVERKIAPFARLKETYVLADQLLLPARLYYDEKLLALIAN